MSDPEHTQLAVALMKQGKDRGAVIAELVSRGANASEAEGIVAHLEVLRAEAEAAQRKRQDDENRARFEESERMRAAWKQGGPPDAGMRTYGAYVGLGIVFTLLLVFVRVALRISNDHALRDALPALVSTDDPYDYAPSPPGSTAPTAPTPDLPERDLDSDGETFVKARPDLDITE